MKDEVSDLRERTKVFALRFLRMFAALPKTEEARVLGRQVLRSGTSVGANYREAQRGRSKAEFIAKIGDCLKGTGRDFVLARTPWRAPPVRARTRWKRGGQFAGVGDGLFLIGRASPGAFYAPPMKRETAPNANCFCRHDSGRAKSGLLLVLCPAHSRHA